MGKHDDSRAPVRAVVLIMLQAESGANDMQSVSVQYSIESGSDECAISLDQDGWTFEAVGFSWPAALTDNHCELTTTLHRKQTAQTDCGSFRRRSFDETKHNLLMSQTIQSINNESLADIESVKLESVLAVLHYAEHFAKPMFVVERGAQLLEANKMAVELLNSHPAFFKPTGGIGLTHSNRNQKLKALIDDTIASNQINYMRVDDGCSNETLMAVITPSPMPNSDVGIQDPIALITIISQSPSIPLIAPLAATHGLTSRQLELLECFAQGNSLAQVAAAHKMRPQSVREMFCEIYKRLGVNDQSDLTRFLSQLPRQIS
ncbi:MAG: helix-turn-helix transcriptional regulator [Rhodobacteraceae bacterium]|nr:helix-turn-helix transcriptional regulator [Paracoccaceae bacterium]